MLSKIVLFLVLVGGVFLGVPLDTFESGGRERFIALLGEGLNAESKLLDFGCGVLRIGWWLIRFLDPGCYYGIEPARQRVEYGLRYLFAPGEVALKQPRFDDNADFDSSVFDVKFDYFLAGSIWTHACKRQVDATLDSFIRDSKPASLFLASYLPALSAEERETAVVFTANSSVGLVIAASLPITPGRGQQMKAPVSPKCGG